MNILATIRTIVLGSTVLLAGLSVTRTSLFGFSVDGRVKTTTSLVNADMHGLDDSEVATVIALVEASVAAPVMTPVGVDKPKSHVVTVRPLSFFAKVQVAARAHNDICGMRIRHSPLVGIRDRVVILCEGQDQAESARRLARALTLDGYGAGFSAIARGTDVLVHEAAAVTV
jgi:hypothetical protein